MSDENMDETPVPENNDAMPSDFEDSYEGEGDNEDEEELIRNIGDDPLMERVQAALTKQLTLHYERVDLEMRDLVEETRMAKEARTDVGQTLYGVQQQLAKLQMDFESTHSKFNEIAERRTKAEEMSRKLNKVIEENDIQLEQEQRTLESNKSELDTVNVTLRQIKEYNEEMKSEIAVTRRAAYKAEENITNLESKKMTQDLLIDSLNEQVKRLHEEIALYEAQRQSQAQETKAAQDTLNDATKEMGAIEFEKKQLMQRWKSSLIGLQRRDEALQSMHDSIAAEREATVGIRAEASQYKKLFGEVQAKNEQLIAQKMKIENNIKLIEKSIETTEREQAKLEKRYERLKVSLEETDLKIRKRKVEGERIALKIRGIEKQTTAVEKERQEVEAVILSRQGQQVTASKAAKNFTKQAAAIQLQIHELEIDKAQIENEVARLKVDCLNTAAHDKELRANLDKLVKELKNKDSMIEKYELEIRQRNDEIEKKMYIVDRLNRKYEQLTSGDEEENLGPLEATIKNLTKQTTTVSSESRELERLWLRHQTELVAVVNESESITSVVHELKSREAIMKQKALRVESQVANELSAVRALKRGINELHNNMSKLNEVLAKNKAAQDQLANENYAKETDFINELKELEAESIRMDQRIEAAKAEKSSLMEEIVLAEKHIMLWEKKIQLEKETVKALDPTVGQSEAKSMEKEIHRMKLRYETLKRDQEKMIREMERSIMKRETISTRNRGKKDARMTVAGLKKKTKQTKGKLRQIEKELKEYDESIKKELNNSENIAMELSKANNRYAALEESANEKQKAINNQLYEKQRLVDTLQRQAKLIAKYNAFKEGFHSGIHADLADRDAKEAVAHAEAMTSRVHRVIEALKTHHPDLVEVLDRVSLLLTDA